MQPQWWCWNNLGAYPKLGFYQVSSADQETTTCHYSNKHLHVFSLSFAHSVHAHLRYAGSCGDSFEECLYESRHFLHTGSHGVCISMVWVNLWASMWTDLKQNTDLMHEQSMNHLSLEEDRPRYYAKSPSVEEHVIGNNAKASKFWGRGISSLTHNGRIKLPSCTIRNL